ncbi:lycopene cyclase domain-containing protein [Arthrobacter sp. Sa2CUA1]|uniref:Lycopene cyclase domain-containing protein n=1 Tax=Arthrobacter gallicola TaxID=2762225 RepID=A0ABR8USN0_9MICC|nr:lycopene cyclase domain-containing protein [Arthrobacter gallicola]MBD7995554.1 lycopene cyclase domain-containing protein [Arthrobacter gallicola]
MTYWLLNLCFLVPAALVLTAALIRRRRRNRSNRAFLAAVAGSAGILLLLTAVFDNLMIAAGLFGYNPDRISGAFLGLAPLEDFAYPLAAVLLLPALWELLGSRKPLREEKS